MDRDEGAFMSLPAQPPPNAGQRKAKAERYLPGDILDLRLGARLEVGAFEMRAPEVGAVEIYVRELGAWNLASDAGAFARPNFGVRDMGVPKNGHR
jgi:hypothetical protein